MIDSSGRVLGLGIPCGNAAEHVPACCEDYQLLYEAVGCNRMNESSS